jgi:hypothetical protein
MGLCGPVTTANRTIELDEATASALEARAAEQGLSVGELVAKLLAIQEKLAGLSPEEFVSLDNRWAAIKGGEPTESPEKVTRWLQAWGSSDFKPWHD